MLTSALVLITMLPLEVSPSGKNTIPFNRPLVVAMFVDSAKILGLPKFRLRDSNGNLYLTDKTLMQEPLATLNSSAGIIFPVESGKRKAFIQMYVRR